MAAKKRLDMVLAQDTLAARIFDKWSGGGDVPLERIESELEDASRYAIVASLKALEKAGVGRFLVGRKGNKSRFVWDERQPGTPTARERASAVTLPVREANKPTARARMASDGARRGSPAVADPNTSRLLTHSFHIRSGVLATLQLPEDITLSEVERLCQLLQAIPFR